MRFTQLGVKPMHTDEAVQADIFMDARESGRYHYDPTEYHGPTLPLFTLLGVGTPTEAGLRRIPVLFSLGLLLLLPGLRDGLGRWEIAVAGVLLALSPMFVYYSRYFIHESLLVFFTLAALVCGWRYAVSRRMGWAILTGVSLGLMHATKETCVMAYAAMFAGVLIQRKRIPVAHLAAGAVAAAAVSVLLFSWFFTHLVGPLDSIWTYVSYLVRSEGSGHEKPWYYYGWLVGFHRDRSGAVWSEGLILVLAVAGGIYALRQPRPLPRFFVTYTLVIALIYSIIPYKTPWLAMNIMLGAALLAGVGMVGLLRTLKHPAAQAVLMALFVGASAHLARQSYQAGVRYHSHARNPYAYSPTSMDLVRLAGQVEDLADSHPDGHDMVIKVISPEYWPLPWYLREFSQVGYWTEVPADPDAAVVLVGPSLQDEVEARFQDAYMGSLAGLRPSVMLVHYTETNLWDRFLMTLE